MKLESISFKTKKGLREVEVIHNLNEYGHDILEFAQSFLSQRNIATKNAETFCEYVIEKSQYISNHIICLPQSLSIDGKLAAYIQKL